MAAEELADVRRMLLNYGRSLTQVQTLTCKSASQAIWTLTQWHPFSKLTCESVRDLMFVHSETSKS
jgi:hypothetical protein